VFYLVELYDLKANEVYLYSKVVESLERHCSAVRELYLYINSDAKLPPVRVLP
jgi:hypothetical protein